MFWSLIAMAIFLIVDIGITSYSFFCVDIGVAIFYSIRASRKNLAVLKELGENFIN